MYVCIYIYIYIYTHIYLYIYKAKLAGKYMLKQDMKSFSNETQNYFFRKF